MRISVIGSGRVGAVVAACFAKLGDKVTVIDTNDEITGAINRGVSSIYEPGLDELFTKASIEATSDYYGIMDSEVIFICVNTPSRGNGSISVEYIMEATKEIASVLKEKEDYCVIAVKSTVVPGTTDEIILPVLESSGKRAGYDFGVSMVPEFLREGRAVYDFLNPTRIIMGEYDSRSGDTVSMLYKEHNAPILRTNLKTAEMIKYASNAFLATKISFINEIGNICKQLGIDTYEVTKGMGFDDRIGNKFLNAGVGFGGSCLPKDLMALIARAREIGYDPRILKEVLNLNERQPLKLIEVLKKHIPVLKDREIGIFGLTFKPETNDVRESRAIKVIEILLQEGAMIKAYDPVGVESFKKLFPHISYVKKDELLLSCEAVLILTEWAEFKDLDYRGKIVIDGRRMSKVKGAGVYESIC